MARQSTVIEVFLSSPSDVSEERRVVEMATQDWNQQRSRDADCHIFLLTWEDMVSPDFADTAQSVIDEQIGDRYDIFLGLMWSRFGTPTGTANSGTEAEFIKALDRKRAGGAITISIFFKMADVPRDKIDGEQIARVDAFKKSVAEKGGLYKEFVGEEQLRRELFSLYDRIAKNKDAYRKDAIVRSEGAGTISTKSEINEDESQSELGLLDVNEQVDLCAASLLASLGLWGGALEGLMLSMQRSTEQINDLSRFGKPEPSELRLVVDEVTSEFNAVSDVADSQLDDIVSSLHAIVALMDKMIDLSSELENNSAQEIDEARISLTALEAAIDGAAGQIRFFVDAILNLPRMSTDFIKARKRLVQKHETLLREMSLARSNMKALFIALDELAGTLPMTGVNAGNRVGAETISKRRRRRGNQRSK